MAHRRFPKHERPAAPVVKAETFVYGKHAVEAVLSTHPERIINVFVQNKRQDAHLEKLIGALKAQSCQIQWLAKETLDQKVGEVAHQGIVLVCQPSQVLSEVALDELLADKANPFLLVLDGVQDPHNLGACLRTADAAGVDAVIIPKDRAVGLTPTVRKVASGAAETVPVIAVTNLARTLKTLKQRDVWLYGFSDAATTSLYDLKPSGAIAVVLGAEGKGMRRLTQENCDMLVSIPMAGSVSSLNVSVAAGVVLFEMVRQR